MPAIKGTEIRAMSAEEKALMEEPLDEALKNLKSLMIGKNNKPRVTISGDHKNLITLNLQVLELHMAKIMMGSGGESMESAKAQVRILKKRNDALELENKRLRTSIDDLEESGWSFPELREDRPPLLPDTYTPPPVEVIADPILEMVPEKDWPPVEADKVAIDGAIDEKAPPPKKRKAPSRKKRKAPKVEILEAPAGAESIRKY